MKRYMLLYGLCSMFNMQASDPTNPAILDNNLQALRNVLICSGLLGAAVTAGTNVVYALCPNATKLSTTQKLKIAISTMAIGAFVADFCITAIPFAQGAGLDISPDYTTPTVTRWTIFAGIFGGGVGAAYVHGAYYPQPISGALIPKQD